MFWHPLEMIQPVPEGMNELDEKLRVLIKIVRQKLNELYPYYYKRSFENRKDLTIVMNTSHKQFMDQLKAPIRMNS